MHFLKERSIMQQDKIVRSITTYVPGTICNFRCKYCYISKAGDEHLQKGSYDYSLDIMIKAFNPKRLGGIAEITVIGGGETLMDGIVIPFIHGLLQYGHVVTVVTNLTLNNRIDQLLNFPKEYLKRLIVKGSLHWEELKRLNKIDDFFSNMNKVIQRGASSYPFLVISKEYMPYLEEINKTCMERLGALPHCSVAMAFDETTDIARGGKVKTDPECTPEFLDLVNKTYDSDVFRTIVRFVDIDVKKIFCYAGKWSFGIDLKNGSLMKCHRCPKEYNFFADIDKMPHLEAIGNNCQIASCALQYNFVGLGLIPEIADVPTYGKMLARSNLINNEVVDLLDIKFSDVYKQYNDKEQQKISTRTAQQFNGYPKSFKYKLKKIIKKFRFK